MPTYTEITLFLENYKVKNLGNELNTYYHHHPLAHMPKYVSSETFWSKL